MAKNIEMQVLSGSSYEAIYPVPANHKNSHKTGGTDAISPSDIGAQSEIPITHTPDTNVKIWIDPNEDDLTQSFYTKSDTDILLQNKAPAGYGLGGNGTEVSDWNKATKNGFYRDAEGTEEKHSPFVGMWTCGYVTNYSSGALVQVAFGFPFVNGKYVRCEKHRGYHNGGWGEWEWVNPPMELGVEYRTTERYFGKPVYRCAFSTGKLANGINSFTPPVVNGGNCRVFRVDATDGYGLPILADHLQLNASWNIFITEASCGKVTLFCGANQVGSSIDIVLHYTRVTD